MPILIIITLINIVFTIMIMGMMWRSAYSYRMRLNSSFKRKDSSGSSEEWHRHADYYRDLNSYHHRRYAVLLNSLLPSRRIEKEV